MANASTHGQFFTLLKQLPEAKKEEIVYAYSNGTTESLSEFHRDDIQGYNLMIRELQKRVQMEIDRETKRLRSAILKRLQEYGVDTTDWHEVNRFLELPQIAGKRLYNMSQDDMHCLIPKLQSILSKNKKKSDTIKQISQLN